MADKRIVCAHCGRSFLWSTGEQRFYKEQKLSPPKRCKACRAQSKSGIAAPKRATPARRSPASSVPHPPKKQRKRRASPYRRYGSLGVGAAVLLTGLLWFGGVTPNGVMAWLIAINVTTLLLFGYDKAMAQSHRQRVPERVLLVLALSFGAVGALVGMTLFRHKTAKSMFQRKFWLVVLLQLLLLWVYFYLSTR